MSTQFRNGILLTCASDKLLAGEVFGRVTRQFEASKLASGGIASERIDLLRSSGGVCSRAQPKSEVRATIAAREPTPSFAKIRLK
jgi:hypothetical protein